MPVTLTPLFSERRLAVTGDIRAHLTIPAEPPSESDGQTRTEVYYIGFSDGSMVMASYSETPEFVVMVEGAGRVMIDPRAMSFTLDWDVEWINLAPNLGSSAFAVREPTHLPLLEAMNASPRKIA